MCDTFVALASATHDNSVIFGKNSDRPQSEVQLITYAPRKKYSKGEEVKCTYITIPQVSETAAILMSQPYWMFGCESGSNEDGVAIGNESVFTQEPLNRIGLLGMDLLRLGLERGKTAREAMDAITGLLEKYGQGGGCAFGDSSWIYHNSFLIADSEEAYVLETADKWWIAEKVNNVRSISNSISIRGKGDSRREGIIQYAIDSGYCKDDDDFDFASNFSGSYISEEASPYSRGGKSTILLRENKGKITPKLMMEFLREHETAGICMHGSFESTGSQISHLRKGTKSIHWFTGSTLPCLSIYKPYVFPVEGQKVLKSGPYSRINPDWFWSKHTSYLNPFKSWSINSEKKDYMKKLSSIEKEIITDVNDIILLEDQISDENFVKKIKSINLKAWNNSLKMIEQ
jgi:secernin